MTAKFTCKKYTKVHMAKDTIQCNGYLVITLILIKNLTYAAGRELQENDKTVEF